MVAVDQKTIVSELDHLDARDNTVTAATLFNQLDSDGDGSISREEFEKLYQSIKTTVKQEHELELRVENQLKASKRRNKILAAIVAALVAFVAVSVAATGAVTFALLEVTKEVKSTGASLATSSGALLSTGVTSFSISPQDLLGADEKTLHSVTHCKVATEVAVEPGVTYVFHKTVTAREIQRTTYCPDDNTNCDGALKAITITDDSHDGLALILSGITKMENPPPTAIVFEDYNRNTTATGFDGINTSLAHLMLDIQQGNGRRQMAQLTDPAAIEDARRKLLEIRELQAIDIPDDIITVMAHFGISNPCDLIIAGLQFFVCKVVSKGAGFPLSIAVGKLCEAVFDLIPTTGCTSSFVRRELSQQDVLASTTAAIEAKMESVHFARCYGDLHTDF